MLLAWGNLLLFVDGLVDVDYIDLVEHLVHQQSLVVDIVLLVRPVWVAGLCTLSASCSYLIQRVGFVVMLRRVLMLAQVAVLPLQGLRWYPRQHTMWLLLNALELVDVFRDVLLLVVITV